MKKLFIMFLTLIAVLFSSCNPDSMTSVLFDKTHAQPSSDFKIYSYIGDYNDTNLILGTDQGIMLYDITKETNPIKVIVPPIARPLMLVDNYVVYYEQENGKDAILKAYSLDENKSYNAELLINKPESSYTRYFFSTRNSVIACLRTERPRHGSSDAGTESGAKRKRSDRRRENGGSLFLLFPCFRRRDTAYIGRTRCSKL